MGERGIKQGLSETSGSFLGTDSPWTHWRNKLCFTVLSVLRGVFCDSGFHSQRTKTPGWPNVTIWSTTTVLSFFCPPGFSTEWTSQGKKTLKARTFLSPKSVAWICDTSLWLYLPYGWTFPSLSRKVYSSLSDTFWNLLTLKTGWSYNLSLWGWLVSIFLAQYGDIHGGWLAQSCPALCHAMDCIAHQVLLSMEFSRQDYWSGLPFPPPGESSWPRDRIRVSCIAAKFFTTEPLQCLWAFMLN